MLHILNVSEGKMEAMEDDILPFGIVEDGNEEVIVDNTGQRWTQADLPPQYPPSSIDWS